MTKLVDSSSQLPRNSYHQFYIDKFRSLSTFAQLINEEIEDVKKVARIRFKGLMKSEFMTIKTGVVYLTDKVDAKNPIRPGQKRCQERLINKGEMDMEYLQQVQEELLSAKKIGGMTSYGTQELNDLINSMAQRIHHGSKNRKEEMKIHDKLRDLKITRDMYTAPEPSKPISSYYGWGTWRCWWNWRRWEKENIREQYRRLRGLNVRNVECKFIYLERDLEEVNSDRRIAYNIIRMLRQLQESCYDEYQSLSLNVNDVAVNVAKVKKLCDTKVEGFKARWNENEAFRDDLY